MCEFPETREMMNVAEGFPARQVQERERIQRCLRVRRKRGRMTGQHIKSRKKAERCAEPPEEKQEEAHQIKKKARCCAEPLSEKQEAAHQIKKKADRCVRARARKKLRQAKTS